MAEAEKKPINMTNVRMTFGKDGTAGILVQAVDIHYGIILGNKWYCSLFRLIAPKVILDAFMDAPNKLNDVILTGEDGTRYKINGVRSRYRESTWAAQDLAMCEAMSLDVDEVIPLEKGPPHHANTKEQAIKEASLLTKAEEAPSGEEAKGRVGEEAISSPGKDPA